jgi:hypothetical protein
MNTLCKSVFAVTALALSQLALPAFAANMDTAVRFTAPTPKDDLKFGLVDGEITFETTDGNEVIFEASGRKDSKMTTDFITMKKSDKEVSFKQEDDTAIKSVKVQIPKNYSGELAVKTVSGTLTFKAIPSKEMEVETVSGEVNGNVATGELAIRTVSGTVNLHNTLAAKETKVKTVSGDVTLKLAADSKFKIKMKSISGDTNNAIGSDKNAKNEVFVQTVSGDISVE